MTTQEFLQELRIALTKELPENEIINHISYYEGYINSKRGEGREEDITASLGDPRLIAKTIIDTYQMQHGEAQFHTYSEPRTYNSGSSESHERKAYQSDSVTGNNKKRKNGVFLYHMPAWLASIITMVLLIFLFSVVFFIGGIILKLFFQIGLPILFIWVLFQALRRK